MTLAAVIPLAEKAGLAALGALHDDGDTILLLGPAPGFWSVFSEAPEYKDGEENPLDRWSSRVITAIAIEVGAAPVFPFGGPPYAPFIRWALESNQAWASPVELLVHETAGLMVSYRGGLRFKGEMPLSPEGTKPCHSCADQPCQTACPVGALTAAGYDVPACKAYIATPDGADCLTNGCRVRRSCPVSSGAKRSAAQSEFHMRAFLE